MKRDLIAIEVVAAPSEIADAIVWLKSGEAMMGPRTEKAVSVLLDAHASALRDAAELRVARGTAEQLLVDAAMAYDDARARRSKARTHQRKLLRDYLGNEGSYYDAAEDRQPEIDAALVEGTASSKAKISAHAKLIRAIKAIRSALDDNTKGAAE